MKGLKSITSATTLPNWIANCYAADQQDANEIARWITIQLEQLGYTVETVSLIVPDPFEGVNPMFNLCKRAKTRFCQSS
jgi:hypothetical protein